MNTIRRCFRRTANDARPVRYVMAFAVTAFAFLTSGCYESSVPLAPREAAALDSSLLGRWLLIGQEDDQAPTHMWIQPYDAHSYRVEFCCADLLNDLAETDLLRAHIVLVDGVSFANVQSLNEDKAPYLFFRYALSNEGILTLRPVAECLFAETDLSTPEVLYGFIQAHLEHERLYLDEALRFRKVGD